MKQYLYLAVYLIFTGIQLLFSSQAIAQEPEISPQFIQISNTRISRSVYKFTFKVTLINHDIAIKNVSATVTSSSANTMIMDDNAVSFNDVATNETMESSDTFVLRQDRTQTFNPDDLHWTISYEPDLPFADVKINLINMTEGGQFAMDQSKGLTTAIHFMSEEGNTPYTVKVTQDISPATGLTALPALDGSEFTYTENAIDKKEQYVRATTPGEYDVTTTATIVETGDTSTHIAKYKVIPADAPNIFLPSPTIHIVGFSMRHALKPDTLTQVTFSMSASGRDYDKVTGMKVIEPDKGLEIILNDKGEGADRTPNNGSYTSHVIELDSTGMESGECLYFHGIVSTSKGDAKSSTDHICVSSLIFDKPYQYKAEDWVRDGSATAFSRTTLSVSFYKGTTDARIIEIVESVDATLVKSNLHFMRFVIKLNHPPSSEEAAAFIRQKTEELEAFPEVRSAGFTIGGGILSTYSTDPLYHSESDNGVSQSRADEAWYVVQGKQPVAILDSGIDIHHEDLKNKLLIEFSKNTAEDNEVITDFNHHGTHVAGIVGAQSNNALGIAGVSRDSKIVPIKIYPGETVTSLPAELMAEAIEYAAELNKEIKVINFSTGFEIETFSFFCNVHILNQATLGLPISDPECIEQADKIKKTEKGRDEVCAAVDYALKKDKIVIVAAGNFYRSNKIYPAACTGAIAVAGVESGLIFSEPERWFETPWLGESTPSGFIGSQYGDWVDIAAPASGVLSTIPKTTCEKDQSLWGDVIDYLFGSCFITTDAYGFFTGTSQASPFVAGAVATILTKYPGYSRQEIEDRLKNSASPMPGEGLGAGALNIFDAVFNGNFELTTENAGKTPSKDPQLEEWHHDEHSDYNCLPFASHFDFGILPPKGNNMLACHNGGKYRFNPSIDSVASGIQNLINIPEGITELPLSFSWKVLSSDLGGLSIYDDRVIIELVRKDDVNKRTSLFATSLNNIQNDGRALSFVPGLNGFLQTDWIVNSDTYPIEYGAGEYYLRIYVLDIWDAVGDTMFLVDDIRFRER